MVATCLPVQKRRVHDTHTAVAAVAADLWDSHRREPGWQGDADEAVWHRLTSARTLSAVVFSHRDGTLIKLTLLPLVAVTAVERPHVFLKPINNVRFQLLCQRTPTRRPASKPPAVRRPAPPVTTAVWLCDPGA